MSIFITMISILALQMLIYAQFFEKRREFYLKSIKKSAFKFLKICTLVTVFSIGAVYVFSRFEHIVLYLVMNAEELLTPERIDTLKNMVIAYISLTLDLSPTGVLFLSFMSFAYYAIFLVPGVAMLYRFYPPDMSETLLTDQENTHHDPPAVAVTRGKIFLELCQLRN